MFRAVRSLMCYENEETLKKKFEGEYDNIEKDTANEDALKSTKTANDLKKSKEEEEANKNQCFKTTGTITTIFSNHGLIDKVLYFDIASTYQESTELKVGARVNYLAYKPQNSDTLKVIKILDIVNSYWDENQCDESTINNELTELRKNAPEYFSIHQRSVLGTIIKRDLGKLSVLTDYGTVVFELDHVAFDFVPQCGDLINLHCNVQTDESYVTNDGELLDVKSFMPTITKPINGCITKLEKDWGVVDYKCFFTFDILSMGYTPALRDKVKGESIESITADYGFRCISLTPLEAVTAQLKQREKIFNRDLSNNNNGLVVTDGIKFFLNDIGDEEIREISITNNSGIKQKVIRSFFVGKKNLSQLSVIEPDISESFYLQDGENRIFKMKCVANNYGLSEETFVILFGGGVKVHRKIKVDVGKDAKEDEKMEQPFKHVTQKRMEFYANEVWARKYNIVPGVKMTNKPRFVTNRIGMFDVPDRLREAFLTAKNRAEMTAAVECLFPCLLENLTFQNYCNRMHLLLHIEEIEYFVSMRKYDRKKAHFTVEGEYLALEIENLSERRPSLVINDTIRATSPCAESGDDRCYEGVIHKILHNKVLIKFNTGFQAKYNGEDYRLEFNYSRFNFRKQHYSVKKVIHHLGESFLFPSKISLENKIQLDISLDGEYNLIRSDTQAKLKWFNKDLNTVQKIAIKNVLRGEARPMPYVIFGPPGTGKTLTLVELIIQLVLNLPNARLIIATPSNSAADLIATRLLDYDFLRPGDFVRLLSQNVVERDMVPDHLKQYCATIDIQAEGSGKDSMVITQSGLKLRCQQKHLGRHRITISTCSTIGNLLQMGFPAGHFTHILIDEAGQCLETEAMMAICQVDKFSGQVILAGDPLQLGPIVLNKYAAQKGLAISLLGRLLSRTPYSKDKTRFADTGYDQRLLTKLIYNYRAIPSILKTYNDIFYDSELKPMIDYKNSPEAQVLVRLTSLFKSSDKRPPEHGVFFVGIRGENKQEADSPSWYNAYEAINIYMFVTKLRKMDVNFNDIGIITPYQKQVQRIRNLFLDSRMQPPKVGSVEEFQGQERDIILISTVRSTKNLVQFDLQHSLGFVQCPKRMNVAISRARSLLVIYGNPQLLAHDQSWEKLIKYCVECDAYSGCDLPTSLWDK